MSARVAWVHAAWACAVLVIAACVTPRASEIAFFDAPRPPAGKALVYVLRSDAAAATLDIPSVLVDSVRVTALQATEYTAIHLAAGRHTVRTDSMGVSSRPLAFTVASGQVVALALEFSGMPRSQAGGYLMTKQGKMYLPEERAADSSFSWTFVPDIEANPLAAELRQRRYRAAEPRELVPG